MGVLSSLVNLLEGTKPMITIRLKALLEAKAREEKRRKVPLSEVSRATGISRLTLKRWVENDVKFYSADCLVALCLYFDCQVGDILSLEKSE